MERPQRGERPLKNIISHLGSRVQHIIRAELRARQQQRRAKRYQEPSDFDLPQDPKP